MKWVGLYLASTLVLVSACGLRSSGNSDVESTGSMAYLQTSADLTNFKLTGNYAKYSAQAAKALTALGVLSNGKSVCTAFAVSPTAAITSGHCLASGGSDCGGVKIAWGLPDPSGKPQKNSKCLQVLQYANKDGQGDYAVLKLDSGPEGGAFVSWGDGNPLATRGAQAFIAGFTAENKLQVTTQCNIDAARSKWKDRQKASVQDLFRRDTNCSAYQGMSGALVFELDSENLRPVGVHSGQGSGDGLENMTNLSGFLGDSKRLISDAFAPADLEKAILEGKGRAICQESYADFLYGKRKVSNVLPNLNRGDENKLRDWFSDRSPKEQEAFYTEWNSQLADQNRPNSSIETLQSLCKKQLSDTHADPFGNDACTVYVGGKCDLGDGSNRPD